jgi:hypothetical protein
MSLRRPLSLLTELEPRRVFRVSGTRYEIGYQHGLGQQSEIRRFLNDHRARLELLMAPRPSWAELAAAVERHAVVIEATLPAMADELRGLADGAEISLEEAYLLQLRRELVGYRKVGVRGDCTTFGRLTADGAVLGQTIDLNGNMASELSAIEVVHQGNGRRVLLVSFTGLLGYLGLNDSGLAICLNLVLGGEWRAGIPGYMAIRQLLDEASTVQECIDLLGGMPLASSRALTIYDGSRLVSVEYILNEMAVLEGDVLVHTNHFLHPRLVEYDELNPFAKTSSLRRLDACVAALDRLSADAHADAYFEILDRPPVHVAPDGDVRRECTVAAVVMNPERGRMFVRQAGTDTPSAFQTQHFSQPV